MLHGFIIEEIKRKEKEPDQEQLELPIMDDFEEVVQEVEKEKRGIEIIEIY